jgi:DNA-binding response OmpR family regulator
MKIVIIEDEQSIIDAISLAFEFRWPDVNLLSAFTGREGIGLVQNESPDVVILDINLPDINGFEVLKQLRSFSNVPVIILSVRSDDQDVMRGLEIGADDYIIKPFNYLTLLARVKSVLRRSEVAPLQKNSLVPVNARLKIDYTVQKVLLDDVPVKLTPVEYRLLVSLVKNKDRVISYGRIIRDTWEKSSSDDTENLRIHIRRLRSKLHDNPPVMITNKRGSGYMFKS